MICASDYRDVYRIYIVGEWIYIGLYSSIVRQV